MTEFNAPLARKVLEHIEAHPETHDQGEWRCSTGMCVAGWTAELDGAVWARPANDPDGHAIFVRSGSRRPGDVGALIDGHPCVTVREHATGALGLDRYQATVLFGAHNTAADCRRILEDIAGGAL